MTLTLDKWAIYDQIMPCTKIAEHGKNCPGHPLWEPHRGQLAVAEDGARNQVLAAGRRFGKSFSGGNKLLPEVFYTKPMASTLIDEGRRREFWIVGPEFSDSEKEFRVIWNLLKRLEIPMDKGSRNSPETGDMLIKCWDGALRIEAKSARYPERLVGEGLSGAILAEAAKLKDKVWYKFIRPTLADYSGWSYFSSTPEGKNWFYDLWRKAKDPNNRGWSSFRMPAWINQHVYKTQTIEAHVLKLIELQRQYPAESVFRMAREHELVINDEILQSINDLTPETFLQEIAADFCADTETEILTQRGWLRYNEVIAGDQTLGLKTDGTVEWTDISRVNVFPAKPRKMVQMEMRGHSSLTTPDHRWLVERIDMNSCEKRRKQGKSDWQVKNPVLDSQVIRSYELGDKGNLQVPCARPVTNLPQEQKYTDALVELVAWYWTEGSVHKPGICIAQSKTANLRKWASIASAIIAYCDYYSWSGQQFYIRGEVAQGITQHAPGKEKKLEWDFVASLTRSQLELFIDKSIQGDGWVYEEGGRAITQKLRHNLDVLQMACQLAGYQTNLYKTNRDCWRLNIFERNSFRPQSAKRAGKIRQVSHIGEVWCPSTGTSTWLARRNGTVYFTGNTEFSGRVFKEFDEETHVTDLEWHPGWETYAAVDYGYHNPNVWLLIQVGQWGEINVLAEVYEEGLDPEDFADEIRWRGLNPAGLRVFYADPADPGASKILEKKLGIQSAGGTGGELNSRLNWIRKSLRDSRWVRDDTDLEFGSKRPRLMFDRNCKRTIEDMLNYKYPDKKTSATGETSTKRYDLPMKKDDHGPEALGRFFAGHFGQFGKPHTGAKVHDADYSTDYGNDWVEQDNGLLVPDKHPLHMRPMRGETRREPFPKVNDALAGYVSGDY